MARRSVYLTNNGSAYRDVSCGPVRQAVERGTLEFAALARGGYPGRQLGRSILPQIKSLGVWNAAKQQNWGLDWHRDTGIEITYVSRGRTAFGVDQQWYQLKRDVVSITRPWQWHRIGRPNVGAARLHWLILDVEALRPHQPWRWPDWLLFTPADLKRLTSRLRHNEQPVRHATPAIHESFLKLAGSIERTDQPIDVTRTSLHLNELFIALHDLLEHEDAPLDERLSTSFHTARVFLQSLSEHVDEPWSLPEMAAECGLSRSQFADYCRQIVNMSPIAYLNQCRIERARTMLHDTEASITEVAFACGFNSSQYFATVFNQLTGCSPRVYRESKQHS